MEHLIQFWQEITRNLFQSIDDQSLTNSRIVSRLWKDFIDTENFSLIRINQKYTKKDHTQLHIAAENGHWFACQLLIANSEDKNPKGVFERTPLHLAAEKGHGDFVKCMCYSILWSRLVIWRSRNLL